MTDDIGTIDWAHDDRPDFALSREELQAKKAWAKRANGQAEEAQAPPTPSLREQLDAASLDLKSLSGKTPPKRTYAWDPWIPAGTTTLLHGSGGVGKTLLMQQLLTAYALGFELFGGTMTGGKAFMLAGEDDRDELWRRLEAICRRLGANLADLHGKLDMLSVTHLGDITIAEGGDTTALSTTPFWEALSGKIKGGGYGLCGLDNASMLYAIPESNRGAVTKAVGLLNGLCKAARTTVVLAAHDNKLGDFSGSTAWENACRSRLHLIRDENGTLLKMPKANYSATGEICLVWDDWSFRADDPAAMTPGERLEAELGEREDAMAFLRALDALTEQGCNVSDSSRAANYAPKVILARGLNEDRTKKQLEKGMNLLLREGRIKANQAVGRADNRHQRYGLARV